MAPKKAKKQLPEKSGHVHALYNTPLLVEGAIVEKGDKIAIYFLRISCCLAGCQPLNDETQRIACILHNR